MSVISMPSRDRQARFVRGLIKAALIALAILNVIVLTPGVVFAVVTSTPLPAIVGIGASIAFWAIVVSTWRARARAREAEPVREDPFDFEF